MKYSISIKKNLFPPWFSHFRNRGSPYVQFHMQAYTVDNQPAFYCNEPVDWLHTTCVCGILIQMVHCSNIAYGLSHSGWCFVVFLSHWGKCQDGSLKLVRTFSSAPAFPVNCIQLPHVIQCSLPSLWRDLILGQCSDNAYLYLIIVYVNIRC
jgi:hypothetical protein